MALARESVGMWQAWAAEIDDLVGLCSTRSYSTHLRSRYVWSVNAMVIISPSWRADLASQWSPSAGFHVRCTAIHYTSRDLALPLFDTEAIAGPCCQRSVVSFNFRLFCRGSRPWEWCS